MYCAYIQSDGKNTLTYTLQKKIKTPQNKKNIKMGINQF